MTQYRRVTILATENPGVSGSKIVQIFLKDIVSKFVIQYGVTVATASVMAAPLVEAISKIELVDGSTVLFSLSGAEAVAAAYHRTGMLPFENKSLTVGDVSKVQIPIYFGRELWDQALAFDPSRFVSPQLRITYDASVVDAAAVTTSLAIFADVMDKTSVKPTGIILSKEQNQYNMVASSHEYIALPVDYPLLDITLRVKSSTDSPGALVDNIKFSFDQDAYIFMDESGGSYIEALTAKYPPVEVRSVLDGAVDADTLFVIPTSHQSVVINQDGTKLVTTEAKLSVPTFSGNKLALGVSEGYTKRSAWVKGTLVHGCIPVLFGLPDDPTTWYTPGASTKFQLDLLASAAAGATDTVYVMTEQLRTY